MEDVYLIIPLILFSLVLMFYDRLEYLKYPLIFVASVLDWCPVVFGNMGQILGHDPLMRMCYILVLPLAIFWGKVVTLVEDRTTKTIAEIQLITAIFVLVTSMSAIVATIITSHSGFNIDGLKVGLVLVFHVALTFIAYSYLTVWLIEISKEYYQQFYMIWLVAYICGILMVVVMHGAGV